jgi:hypothetical protein
MSKSTPGLLKAIQDFHAEHGADKEHESTTALLARVAGDIGPRKGKAEDSSVADSPGRQAAREVSMPSEANHDGGEGNKTTNAPGSPDIPDPVADQHDKSYPSQMSGTEPVRSGGNILSAMPGPKAQSGELPDIRRTASLAALEKGKSSAGNAISNARGMAEPNSERMGDVKAPAKAPPDKNTGSYEGTPPFAKESLSGDGWSKAGAKAKQMWAKK